MVVFPNAKINLGLSVVERRADGYHNIETFFYPIPLTDVLEIMPTDEALCELKISGIQVTSVADDNLVMKAYRLLKEQVELPPLAVYLHKQIPFGAGLGGGSSDAASMLLMLNEEFKLGLSLSQLANLAAKLGADCPFFIYNKPVFASGIGTDFEPTTLSLKGYSLLLIKPDLFVSTPEAYRQICPQKPVCSIKEVIQQPIELWKGGLKNDFEVPVFAMYPQLEQLKNELYASGALYASMSGSGSALFGIFKESPASVVSHFKGCFVREMLL